jgi:hypothetical protein
VGLDLKLDFNQSGQLRKENFNELSDYLSVIRYVRYGLKNDPLFLKLGALDYYTLGHGSIMYRYNNSPSYDVKKIGFAADIDFGAAGIETMYSRFAEAGVVGMRGYVRPFRFTALSDIPVINNIETGISYAGDFHEYAGVTSGFYSPALNNFVIDDEEGNINILGVDIGIPFSLTDNLRTVLYLDYAKIMNFGQGAATGLMFNLDGFGIIDAFARIERRYSGRNFIPSYFNAMYEVERFRIDRTTNGFSSKAERLKNAIPQNGIFGELGVRVLNMVEVVGGFQRQDKTPRDGILSLTAQVVPEDFPFIIRAGYDKTNIQENNAIFKLDEYSYLFTEAGYKPLPYIIVSIVYNWTYSPLRDTDNNVIGYEPIKRIEPRISFVYPFDFN